MADYKEMYYALFNRVTDAIHLLQEGQMAAEQTFIDALPPHDEEAPIHVLEPGNE